MNRNQAGQHLRLLGFLHYVLWIVIAITTICLVQVPLRSMADGFVSERTSRTKKENALSRVAKKQPEDITQPVAANQVETPADEVVADLPPERKSSDSPSELNASTSSDAPNSLEVPRRVFAAQAQNNQTEQDLAVLDVTNAQNTQPSNDALAGVAEERPNSSHSGEAFSTNASTTLPQDGTREASSRPLPNEWTLERSIGPQNSTDESLTAKLAASESPLDSTTNQESTPPASPTESPASPEPGSLTGDTTWAEETQSTDSPVHSGEEKERRSRLLTQLLDDKHISLETLLDSYSSTWPRDSSSERDLVSEAGLTNAPALPVASDTPVSTQLENEPDHREALDSHGGPVEPSPNNQTLFTQSTTDEPTESSPALAPSQETSQVTSPTGSPSETTKEAPEAESSIATESPQTAVAAQEDNDLMPPANTIVKPALAVEITIENPAVYRTPLQFVVNDQIVTLAPGKSYTVSPAAGKEVVIRYHRGGSEDQADQQTLKAGRYQFGVRRSIGWDLKRLDAPQSP